MPPTARPPLLFAGRYAHQGTTVYMLTKLPEGTTLREHLADKQAPRNYKVHDVQSMGDVGEL